MRAPLPHLARLSGALVVVAVGAAAFAMAFRAGLSFLYRTLLGAHDVLDLFQHLPWVARIALPAVGGLGAGLVARAAASSGVGDVMEAVALGGRHLSVRATLSKALGSFVAIGTGSSIGREGPLIQFGGSFGGWVAKTFGIEGASARALIAAGTAAGFAAAYNTPLAAVLFVVEIVLGVVAIEPLAMILVATAIATTLVRAVVGGGPIYGERTFTTTSRVDLAMYVVLGTLAALLGHAFMRLLATGERAFTRLAVPQPWRAMVGATMVGLLAVALPEVAGNGYEPLDLLLDGRYAAGFVALLVLAKALATAASVSSGSPGGVFTPSLFLGGGLGLVFGYLVDRMVGGGGSPSAMGSYALVGMAAVVAATTHAPLMSSVLVFELSGDYGVVLPLVLATAVATLLSRRLGVDSIYTAELRRRGVDWESARAGRFPAPPPS